MHLRVLVFLVVVCLLFFSPVEIDARRRRRFRRRWRRVGSDADSERHVLFAGEGEWHWDIWRWEWEWHGEWDLNEFDFWGWLLSFVGMRAETEQQAVEARPDSDKMLHEAEGSQPILADHSKDESAAHMMLVIQWPESLCASSRRSCISNDIPLSPHFTLHGLWPTARGHHWMNCRSDFNVDDLTAALRNNLTMFWPSMYHRDGEGFWKHEYHKHGSCLYESLAEYVNATLSLRQKYDLQQILIPSDQPQPLSFYRQALIQAFGGEPMLMCQRNWLTRRLPNSSTRHHHKRKRPVRQNKVATSDGMDATGHDDKHESGYSAGDEDDSATSHPLSPPRLSEQLLVEVGICLDHTATHIVDCPRKGRIRRCQKGEDVLLPALYTYTQPPVKKQVAEEVN